MKYAHSTDSHSDNTLMNFKQYYFENAHTQFTAINCNKHYCTVLCFIVISCNADNILYYDFAIADTLVLANRQFASLKEQNSPDP